MRYLFSKRIVTTVLVVIALGAGVILFFILSSDDAGVQTSIQPENTVPEHKVIGVSVEGRKIDVYTYGNGKTHIAFVGGVHGGYEWNSVLLAYKFMDYLDANPTVIPKNLTVSVIPSANPDGVYKVIGKEGRFAVSDVPTDGSTVAGRFNAHGVDLNRNFDCKWKPQGTWRGSTVSAGSSPFSEPEAVAIRNFVLESEPVAVIFWHSQANTVYASECEAGILPETLDIMSAYANASGYLSVDSFDQYEINGDAEGWLASIGIPAITVELKTHETVEWEQNLAGIEAVFEYYKK